MGERMFGNSFMVHVFHGEARKGSKRLIASGLHHESEMLSNRIVLEGNRSKPDRNGVYSAKVVFTHDGRRSTKRTSFFPREWTRSQVLAAVREVYNQKPEGINPWGWAGRSSGGVYIYLLLNQEGQIISAFPKKERRRKPCEERRRKYKLVRQRLHRRQRRYYALCMYVNWMRLMGYDEAFVPITRGHGEGDSTAATAVSDCSCRQQAGAAGAMLPALGAAGAQAR